MKTIAAQKDAIAEGKHDHHAALRYILQSPLSWYPLDSPMEGSMRDIEAAIEAVA